MTDDGIKPADIKVTDGLSYSICDNESGHLANIGFLGSSDLKVAATARLNRDLVNVISNWLKGEEFDKKNAVDLMKAAMHGVNTICGTILLNLKPEAQAEVGALMRTHLIDIFDSMLKSVREDQT